MQEFDENGAVRTSSITSEEDEESKVIDTESAMVTGRTTARVPANSAINLNTDDSRQIGGSGGRKGKSSNSR